MLPEKKKNLSKFNKGHRIFPYLLKNVPIERVNQVWSTNITCIRLEKGFVYLAAVIDWHSRHVISWRLSNTPTACFCTECLKDALQYGAAGIIYTKTLYNYSEHSLNNGNLDPA